MNILFSNKNANKHIAPIVVLCDGVLFGIRANILVRSIFLSGFEINFLMKCFK